jgi:hypothetical protein
MKFNPLQSGIACLTLCTLVLSACSNGSVQPTAATFLPVQTQAETRQPDITVQTPTQSEPALKATPGREFCADKRVQDAILALDNVITSGDGTTLAVLIDPEEGLDIYYTSASQPVNISTEVAAGLFADETVYTWGDHPGSGLPVEGTFRDQILPLLLDVFDRTYTQSCQSLERGAGTGPTTAVGGMPATTTDLPFIALYRAAGPEDNELDWRTWVVGFTVVDGQPKIRVLVQFFWEI